MINRFDNAILNHATLRQIAREIEAVLAEFEDPEHARFHVLGDLRDGGIYVAEGPLPAGLAPHLLGAEGVYPRHPLNRN